jgi:hypothetical protein
MSLPVEPYDIERMNRALSLYSALGRHAALSTMRNSRPADFNPINVSSALVVDGTSHRLIPSFQSTTRSLSKTSSSAMEDSIPKKRVNCSKSVLPSFCDTRISGKTSNSKPRTKQSVNIVKSIPHMLDRTRRSEHHHLGVYELETGQKTLTLRDHCLAMKSRIPRRHNALPVRLAYRAYGGEHRGLYLEMRCARIAGEFPC